MTVAGTTTSAATNVTVNTLNAILYADSTFARTNLSLIDGTNSFTAIAKDSLGRVDTNTVVSFLPANLTFSYDLNGNLLSDGLRAFDYDDENQLIRVTVTNVFKSEFSYDWKMRRRIRREYAWLFSAWHLTNEVHYLYDGNLVIQERDANNVPVDSYTRGDDLSGSLEVAGGIGGLLAFSQLSTLTPQHYYYHADGNGNVTMLINSLQLAVAKYLYDPFGNTISSSGLLADANCYRFSSKEYHSGSGLYSFGLRLYDPSLQRWPNRDPYGEVGFRLICPGQRMGVPAELLPEGSNLHRFVRNNSMCNLDPWGLKLTAEDCHDFLKCCMGYVTQIMAGGFSGPGKDCCKKGIIGAIGKTCGKVAGTLTGGADSVCKLIKLGNNMKAAVEMEKQCAAMYAKCVDKVGSDQ